MWLLRRRRWPVLRGICSSVRWPGLLRLACPAVAAALLFDLPVGTLAQAQWPAPLPPGYLCCNLRVYRDWISDINYRFDGTRTIPAGTHVRATAWARYSVSLKVGAKVYWLGNDYSRDLNDRQFAARYILPADPRKQIEDADPFTRDAIARSMVMPGMTHTEVAMALGYPVANYTPRLAASVWKYWIDRTGEFTVRFDAGRRVASIGGDARALGLVLYRPQPEIVRRAQSQLNDYGFDAGEVDGLIGRSTRNALKEFQRLNGLRDSGQFDAQALRRLNVSPG